MSMEESTGVRAAVALENRLTRLEAKIDQVLDVQKQLVENGRIANGRVTKQEQAHREHTQQHLDREELIDKPRWGRFEAIASQVGTLMQDKANQTVMQAGKQRFWDAFKQRLDIIAVVILIIGGPDLLELIKQLVNEGGGM